MARRPSSSGTPSPDSVRVSVTVQQPPTQELLKVDRAARQKLMLRNTTEQQRSLLNWLEDHHLRQYVSRVSKHNALSTFFLETTLEVAQKIKTAPGVVNVAVVSDIAVELLDDED